MNSPAPERRDHTWDLNFQFCNYVPPPRGDDTNRSGTWVNSLGPPYSRHLSVDEPSDEPEKLKNEPSQPVQWQLHSSMINSNASSVADQNGFMDEIVVTQRQPPNLQATPATLSSNSGSPTNSSTTDTKSTESAAATPSSTTCESDSTRAIENFQQVNHL